MIRLTCLLVLFVLPVVFDVPVIGQDEQPASDLEESWNQLSRRTIDGTVAALRSADSNRKSCIGSRQ